MNKIAIIGVDGSGKTVLMAALGAHFESPDKQGKLLTAKDQATFTIVKRTMGLMRKGQWPSATDLDTSSMLRWDFCQIQNDSLQQIAELEFLDYAGEIYRLAFGNHSSAEIDPYQKQINLLRNHITSADSFFLLINLKDIISGDETHSRTLEMLWVTKDILDFLKGTNRIDRVTLVFTQAASYYEIIANCGGELGAYKKYLPHIYHHYPKLPCLAVSAVNEVVLNADGYEVPAPNFTSTGLDVFLEAINITAHHTKGEKEKNKEENYEEKKEEDEEELAKPRKRRRKTKTLRHEAYSADAQHEDAEAKLGLAEAQFRKGRLFYYSSGGEHLAVEWLRKAAKQDYPEAQNLLGDCYRYGRGVRKDEDEAQKWYLAAAELGNVDAQRKISKSSGSKKDEVNAPGESCIILCSAFIIPPLIIGLIGFFIITLIL